jgi:uncharacterized protein with GYD domain
MPFFMTQFAYTTEGVAALVKKPEDRSAPLKALVEKFGGRLLSFYYCFGEYDGIAITEAPDAATVLSVLFAVIVAGHLRAVKTTELFTVPETMGAMSKAGTVMYPPPKG